MKSDRIKLLALSAVACALALVTTSCRLDGIGSELESYLSDFTGESPGFGGENQFVAMEVPRDLSDEFREGFKAGYEVGFKDARSLDGADITTLKLGSSDDSASFNPYGTSSDTTSGSFATSSWSGDTLISSTEVEDEPEVKAVAKPESKPKANSSRYRNTRSNCRGGV